MLTQNDLICKNCGAHIDPSTAQGGVVRCTYCRSTFTLPKTEGAAREFLYQGEHELDTCEFDRAYTAYRKAAELDPSEPEAYFGMALASFKVQYIKDNVNNCLQPICHDVTDRLFKSDPNYRKAVSLATPEQRVQYDRKAKDIDYIEGEFLALRESGAKYDCFLCTKVTGDDGGNTQESYDTLKIYNYLKSKGYSPFYSEQEINERTGVDYEALILYALQSAKCMLIVCRNENYLRTPWVENEYRRFLALINDERKESDAITFVFGGKPIEKLPGRNGKIQGINLDRPDAYSRIIDYVENHAGNSKKDKKAEEERRRAEEEARRAEEEARRKREEEERRKREEEERRKRDDEQAALLDAYRKQLDEMKSMLSGGNFAQPSPAPVPAPVETPKKYELILQDRGPNQVPAVKLVQKILQCGLIEAKQKADSTPAVIKGDLELDEVEKWIKLFEEVGATAVKRQTYPVPVETPTAYTLVLQDCGPRKIDVIKVIREMTNCGLVEGKMLSESAPVVIKKDLSPEEVEKWIKRFQEAGATARKK